MPNYTVNNQKNGKHTVSYECGYCQALLESPLQEAGQSFPCPKCGKNVETPGIDELRKHRLQREQERIEEAKRNEVNRVQKEIAEARRVAEAKSQAARKLDTAVRAVETAEGEINLVGSSIHPIEVFLWPAIGCLVGFLFALVLSQVRSVSLALDICVVIACPVTTLPVAFMDFRFTRFTVTNRRIIIRRGWLRRRTFEMLLNKVESVYVEQSIIGRLFGFGTVVINGTGGSRERFEGIRSPDEFRRIATDAIEQRSK